MPTSLTKVTPEEGESMAKKHGPKFYGVRVGRTPGVYLTREECKAQTAGYPGNTQKAFRTHKDAADWVAAGSSSSSDGGGGGGGSGGPTALPATSVASSAKNEKKKKSGTRYYAVAAGYAPGIYTDYTDAQAAHSGFKGSKHQSFDSRAEAEAYLRLYSSNDSGSGSGSGDTNPSLEDGNEDIEDDDDGSSTSSWSDGDDDDGTIKVEDVAPGSFMLSVYESTQREQQQASLIDLTGDSDDDDDDDSRDRHHPLLPPSSAQPQYAPSSAQQQQQQQRPPPSYFDQFDNFKPDASASFDDEFARCMSSQAIAPRTAEYRLQRTRAIAQEIKFHYSQDDYNQDDNYDNDNDISLTQVEREEKEKRKRAHRLKMYQNLCRATRLPIYASLRECEDALRGVLVNIVDYIDAARAGDNPCVEVWDDFDAFREYTLGGDGSKCIDIREAKRIDGGFLTVLLRNFRRGGGGGDKRRSRKRKRGRERDGAVNGRGDGVVTGGNAVKCARVL